MALPWWFVLKDKLRARAGTGAARRQPAAPRLHTEGVPRSGCTAHCGGVGSPRARVLLVERNGALRQVLVEALEELGFDVVAAGGRKQALDALLSDDDPDLLLVDLVDDAAGGERLLSFVDDHEHLAAIPVIAMTDGAEPVQHARAR